MIINLGMSVTKKSEMEKSLYLRYGPNNSEYWVVWSDYFGGFESFIMDGDVVAECHIYRR